MKNNFSLNLPIRFFACLLLFSNFQIYSLSAATCTWNGGSGNWNNAANWDCGVVPDSDDDVVINSGTVTLDIVTTVQSLSLGGGDLILDNAITVSGNASMTSASSEISGTDNLNIGGDLTWDRGIISGAGSLVLTGSLTSSNGIATLKTRSLTLTNGGTWTDQSFELESGATITVPMGKTLTINVANTEDLEGPNGNSGTLVNNGTIEKIGTGFFNIKYDTLENNGTLNISAGEFDFATGSVSTHNNATVNISSGTTMFFNGNPSTNTFTNTSISNNGTFSVAHVNSTVTLNGTSTLNNVVDLTSGHLTLDNAQTFSTLSLTGGDLTLNASLTISGDMTMDSGGSDIDGNGDLSINGVFTWNNGDIRGSGNVNVTGTSSGTGGHSVLETKTMTINSGGTMTNHSYTLRTNAKIIIPTGQTLTIDNSSTKSFSAANGNFGTIENNGTIEKNGAGIFEVLYNTFDNNGTLNINNGTFYFKTGSTSTHDNGTVSLASGTTMRFAGNASFTHDFTNTSISGAGKFYLSTASSVNINAGSTFSTNLEMQSGTFNLNVDASIPSLMMFTSTTDLVLNANLMVTGDVSMTTSNAEISGTGDLTINGDLTWASGTISGTGAFTLNGVFTGTNGQNATLDTRTLTFNAGGTWTDFELDLLNAASITIPSGQALTIDIGGGLRTSSGTTGNPGTIINDGTIIKNGTGEYAIVNNILDNNGDITINAGILSLGNGSGSDHDGGSISIASGTEFECGGASTTHTFDNVTISGAGTFKSVSSCDISINAGSSISNPIIAGSSVSNFTLNVDATIPSLTIANKNIVLNANLTVTGNVAITTGASYTSISGPGNFTINGDLDWGGGAISGTGTLTLNGTLTSDNFNTLLDTRDLSLTSGGYISDIVFQMANGATLTVPNNKTLTLFQSGGQGYVTNGTLVNNGTIEKTGAGDFRIETDLFTNTGNLTVTAGTLLGGVGSGNNSDHDNADVSIATGATWRLTGNTTHDFDNTSISGPGKLLVASFATVNLNTGTTTPNLPVEILQGNINFNVNSTIASLTQGSAGTLSGTFTLLNITGDMITNGFTITTTNPSTIAVGGNMTITTSSVGLSNTSIELNGGGTWTNAVCNFQNNANVTIPAGQTLTINNPLSNETMVEGTGSGNFINNGTLIKSGAQILWSDIPITVGGNGVVDIQQGTLQPRNTFTNNGTIKGTGTLNLTSATVNDYGTFAPGSSPGTLTVTGDYTNESLEIEIEAGPPVAFDVLSVSGAVTLGGTLTVTETGNVPAGTYTIITGSSVTGSFATEVLPDCYRVEVSGGNVNLVKGVTKVWDGSTGSWSTASSWSPSGVPCFLDDVVINSGTVSMDVQPDMQSLTVNGGILKKVGADTKTIDDPFVLAAGAELNVFEGTLDINSTFTPDGLITGTGTYDVEDATVSGGYNIAPGNSTGRLKNKGTYCNENAFLELEESASTVSTDELEVTVTLESGGNLELQHIGGTIPAGTYQLMYCLGNPACRSGTFASITYPPSCLGNCSVVYTATAVNLVVSAPLVYTCVWNGGTGSFSDPSQWACGEVPPATANIIVNSGQVNLDGNVTVAGLTMNGGTIAGTGNLNITNHFEWGGGTMSAAGLHQATTVSLLNNPTLAEGTLSLTGASSWIDPNLTILGTAVLRVATGGTLTVTSNNPTILAQGGSGKIVVEGGLTKAGTSNWKVDVDLELPGTLAILEGILEFNGGFDYTGTVKGTGVLDVVDATVTSGVGANFSPGNSPGVLTLGGDYENKELNIEIEEVLGATSHDRLDVTGNVALDGQLNILHIQGTVATGTYTILTCGGGTNCLQGNFTNVTFPTFCSGDCSINVDVANNRVEFVYGSALPVELVSFRGQVEGGSVVLSWETAAEVDTDWFEVERSPDGMRWQQIGEVAALGTPGQYNFIDNIPFNGFNHYRLRIIDKDGSYEYSKIIAVEMDRSTGWQVFPNPVKGFLTVRFAREESGLVELYNGTGRKVLVEKLAGQRSITIDFSHLPEGLYWMSFSGGGSQMIVKHN